MRLLSACAVLAALAFVETARAQQIDPAKTDLIHKIITTTRAGDQIIGVIESSVPAQRAASPRIPAVFWDRFLERANSRKQELLDSMVPIYARIFTTRELELLLQFYESDIGQRFVALQPRFTQELMEAGRAWGERLGIEIGQELSAEGVKFE